MPHPLQVGRLQEFLKRSLNLKARFILPSVLEDLFPVFAMNNPLEFDQLRQQGYILRTSLVFSAAVVGQASLWQLSMAVGSNTLCTLLKFWNLSAQTLVLDHLPVPTPAAAGNLPPADMRAFDTANARSTAKFLATSQVALPGGLDGIVGANSSFGVEARGFFVLAPNSTWQVGGAVVNTAVNGVLLAMERAVEPSELA